MYYPIGNGGGLVLHGIQVWHIVRLITAIPQLLLVSEIGHGHGPIVTFVGSQFDGVVAQGPQFIGLVLILRS